MNRTADNERDGPNSRSVGSYAEARKQKRALLAEQQSRWAEGESVSPEEMLKRWPTDPQTDSDVASLLFKDLLQRRSQGDDPSIDEYSERFPNHKRSLAGLVSQQEFLRSIGEESSIERCTLRFPEVGDELFGYRFIAELGRGAFARVFLAEQIELSGRAVAVKVSAIEGNEPQTLAQMQHTHIVPIYSVQEDQLSGLRAVCMPYYGGASLSGVLHELWNETKVPLYGQQMVNALKRIQSPVAPVDAKANEVRMAGTLRTPLMRLSSETYVRAVALLGAQLAEGLQHAHQRGVLHRDIKPSNILLSADGQPMLLDFNLSQDQKGDPAAAVLGGTVAYMSPEHLLAMSRRSSVLASQVDHRSDIYSLGMVLYEMLAGQKPFDQSASYSVLPLQLEALAAERSRGGLSVRVLRPDIPWGLESILQKCLAPKAADRYQQAEHLAEDLRCLLDDEPLRYAPEGSRVEQLAKWTRRHPQLTRVGAVTLIAGLLLTCAVAAVVTLQKNLVGTQEELGLVQAHERKRSFEAGTVQALCLVNTTVGPQDHLAQGVKVCEETLGLYGILIGESFEQPRDWLRLPEEDRRALAEDTRELLMLLASARVRLAPADPSVLREALRLLDRAETVADLPPSRALWLDRARYLSALRESTQADVVQWRAEQIPVASAREHYLLATAIARAGTSQHYTRAIAELDQALLLDPRHYWSWLQRGICHTELGELVLAAGDFGHCTGLWSEFAWGHFNLGYVQVQSGKLSEGIVSYTRALKYDPDLVAARVNRGLASLELKRYQEALNDLDLASAHGKNDAALHAGRGMALEALKRRSDADAAFRLAFARTADLPLTTRLRMRWTYAFALAARSPAEARRAFNEVLAEDPRNAQACYGLAMLAMKEGEASEALRLFDKALESAPTFFDARRYRAVQLARTGSLKRATEDINWCLEKEPRSGNSLYAAACVASLASQRLGDPKLAEQSADLLERAFVQGVGLDKVETDVDLAGLRAHPTIWRRIRQAREAALSETTVRPSVIDADTKLKRSLSEP